MTDHSKTVPAEFLIERGPHWHESAILVLRSDGSVSVLSDQRNDGDNSVTPDEYHRCVLTWPLESARQGACAIDVDTLREDLSDGGRLSVLLDRIHDGHSIEWNGSNHIGILTENAREACCEISHLIEVGRRYVSEKLVWTAYDRLIGEDDAIVALKRLGLTVAATDDEIDATAKECSQDAATDGIALIGDVAEAIREIIAEAKEEIEDIAA